MLQRIQSLYMLLVIILMTVLYFWFPKVFNESGEVVLDNSSLLVSGLIFGSIILTLISIFKFKTRQMQFVLNRLSSLLIIVLLGVFVYVPLSIPGGTSVPEKGIGLLIPTISIVLLVIANKAIKKDEELVKSVDRLR